MADSKNGIHSSSLDPVDEWSKSEYSHQNAMKQIDLMQSHLENLKESLMKSRVRCHILEVDLATQFSPYMMEAIRNTEQNCQKCVKTISEKCQQTQEI